MNTLDYQLNRERQQGLQRVVQNARLAREAQADQPRSNAALAGLGRLLEQVGENLQAQYGATEPRRTQKAT